MSGKAFLDGEAFRYSAYLVAFVVGNVSVALKRMRQSKKLSSFCYQKLPPCEKDPSSSVQIVVDPPTTEQSRKKNTMVVQPAA